MMSALFAHAEHRETAMNTTLLGLFDDCELAQVARAKLLVSEYPIDRIVLAAVQGPGQSRVPAMPLARDKFFASLRALFSPGGDPRRAEYLADRVERGAATVSARAHNYRAASRVAAVLRDCGALEVVREAPDERDAEQTTGDHEPSWPSFLWPAT
jgi:hypothetical protein